VIVPDDGILLEAVGGQLPAARQDAERDGEIKRGGLLGKFRWREVNHHAIVGPLEP
jgi:hypothetical protein